MANVSGEEVTLRAAAVLTTSYVISTNAVDVFPQARYIELSFAFTVGASTGFRFYVEESDDGTTWYEQSIYHDRPSKQADLYEITIPGTCTRSYRAQVTRRYVRVRAKALVDAGGTSLAITARSIRE